LNRTGPVAAATECSVAHAGLIAGFGTVGKQKCPSGAFGSLSFLALNLNPNLNLFLKMEIKIKSKITIKIKIKNRKPPPKKDMLPRP
jgi:hypothetical protein